MLIRGQTTEERIGEIANKFSQGLSSYAQSQRQEAGDLKEERLYNDSLAAKKAELEQKKAERQRAFNADAAKKAEADYQASQRALGVTERDSYLEKAALLKIKGEVKPLKENLTYAEKLDMKAQKDRENEANKAPTSDQRKVATFAERLEQSEKDFNELNKIGFNRASNETAIKASLPNFAKDSNLKRQDQAERNFVNALLRRESGSAIGDSEFKSAEVQYFPRAGDTPEVLIQKQRNREIVLAGLRAEAGERSIKEIKSQLGTPAPSGQAIDPLRAELEQRRALKAKSAGV